MSCNFCDCLPITLPLYDDMRQAVFAGPTASADFQFAFDYLDKASFSGANSRYVKVYRGTCKGEVSAVSFSMPNASTVRVSSNLAANEFLLVRADDKPNEEVVDFTDPNVTSADLDLGYKHTLFNIRSLFDRLKDINCRINQLCGVETDNLGGPVYTFDGDCTATTFTLDNVAYGPQTDLGEEDILVFFNGVLQPPGAYQIDNSTGTTRVVFDHSPTNTDNIYVKVISNARVAYRVQEGGLADGSVTTPKLADGAVTPQKTNFGGSNGQVLKRVGGTWQPSSVAATEVTGFDTQVRTNSLSQLLSPTVALNLNSQQITNLADGTAANHAVNKGQLDAAVAAVPDIADWATGGHVQWTTGIMPDLYFRGNHITTRLEPWNSYYPGVVPQVALTNRSSTEVLLNTFVPRRMDLLIAGQIRRNNNSNIVHGHTNISRVFEFIRWDDTPWFNVPDSTPMVSNYKSYTLRPLNVGTRDFEAVANIVFTLEMSFVPGDPNPKTWLYITGNGFGSELMRLVNPSNTSEPGVVQLIAVKGY